MKKIEWSAGDPVAGGAARKRGFGGGGRRKRAAANGGAHALCCTHSGRHRGPPATDAGVLIDLVALYEHTRVAMACISSELCVALLGIIADPPRLFCVAAWRFSQVMLCAQILVSCTKGILNDTLETVDQILVRVLPPAFHSRLAFLSGPSFAAEVAQVHCPY